MKKFPEFPLLLIIALAFSLFIGERTYQRAHTQQTHAESQRREFVYQPSYANGPWLTVEPDRRIVFTRDMPVDVLLCLPLSSGDRCALISEWTKGK